MERKEYLKEFFSQVDQKFGMDISKLDKGVKFAFECLRQKLTIDEALDKLEKEYCLIKIKEDEEY